VTSAALQLAAWCGAFWLALWLYARRAPGRSGRFALALGVGTLLARAGESLLWGAPARLLQPGESFSVLFLPLGVLLVSPQAAAFASLPLALALARLGCLAAGCCRGASGEPLPLFEALAWTALHPLVARGEPGATAGRFALAFGALRLAEAPWRAPAALAGARPLATPEQVALGWVLIGACLWSARMRRRR
jgi:hypothetical protein